MEMLSASIISVMCLLGAVTAESFLNPVTDFARCGLDHPSTICDPDGVLTNGERIRIANELRLFEPRTSLRKRGEKRGNCSISGISPAIYLVRNGDETKIEALAKFVKGNWNLDKTCKNQLIIVFAANDTRYQIGRPEDVPRQANVRSYEVAHFMNREVENFLNGRIGDALSNVLKKVLTLAVTKYPVYKATTFPNPMQGGHAQCKVKSAAPLCDPDGFLSDEERDAVVQNLRMFEAMTRNTPVEFSHRSSAFCREKGYSIGVAVMRRMEGVTRVDRLEFTNHLMHTWKLDTKCDKHMLIVIAVSDGVGYAGFPGQSLLLSEKFDKYFANAGPYFNRLEFRVALREILASAYEDARSGALFSPFMKK